MTTERFIPRQPASRRRAARPRFTSGGPVSLSIGMTDMTNRRATSTLMLLTTVIITALNLYLLFDAIPRAPLTGKIERLHK